MTVLRYNHRLFFFLRVSKPLSFGGWCAADSDNNPYLEINFQRETVVQALATQGLQYLLGNWVSEYAVNYSCDGYRWTVYTEGGKQKVKSTSNCLGKYPVEVGSQAKVLTRQMSRCTRDERQRSKDD